MPDPAPHTSAPKPRPVEQKPRPPAVKPHEGEDKPRPPRVTYEFTDWAMI